ncbi:polyprenol phosphomannose-dependent alpha 1,6 mannosyltransferase MptB [Paractinoplanes maris]|uniref:polyprenol phosphomannose-dependent alpha 1,6 mannosyltransferase MptB n=1 Tax=Paractinoplanes maris TaxID=1734446 RepID=UPI0020221435|nr:polyprenol phosphomannose-dependent alpha 1,6 mannosyltransferase MptB [Actinoplanes maris]
MLSRPAVVRYLGLFGALCCAADAVLFGAPSWIRRGVSVMSILRGPDGVLIMLLWIAGLTALCLAWWHGRRLTVSRTWIGVTAALWSLPLVAVPPLASRDMYAYACQGALFDAGFNPSVAGVSAQPCPWLESVSVVWRDTPTPYGPLWIMLAGLAAVFGSQVVALAVFRVYAVLAVVALAVVTPVLARRLGVAENRALWLVVCCPIVPVHMIGGGHNDALALALLFAGLAMVVSRRIPVVSRHPSAVSRRPSALSRRGSILSRRPSVVSRRSSVALLAGGGALIGAAIAVKITMGVVLPFAALLAAGGLELDRAGLTRALRRGGAVVGGAVAALVALSLGSGLGFGWLFALSGAGESRSWTSPATAVGLAVNAAARGFGATVDAVPAARTVAFVLLAVALVVIWWRFRRGDQLAGAGLALLAVIFLAPITQPWYLLWPLAVLAVTVVATRWLEIAVIVSMFLILPNGDGAWKPLQIPLAFLAVGLVGWVAWRSVRWLREPVPGRAPEPVPGAPAPGAPGSEPAPGTPA